MLCLRPNATASPNPPVSEQSAPARLKQSKTTPLKDAPVSDPNCLVELFIIPMIALVLPPYAGTASSVARAETLAFVVITLGNGAFETEINCSTAAAYIPEVVSTELLLNADARLAAIDDSVSPETTVLEMV